MATVKPVLLKRYDALEECFCACMRWDKVDWENIDKHYWCGYSGFKPYRQNVGKWLRKCPRKAWGWAEYKTKTVHVWTSKDCEPKELINLLAHEIAHLNRPRYKDGREEERKANRTGEFAQMAYEMAMELQKKDS